MALLIILNYIADISKNGIFYPMGFRLDILFVPIYIVAFSLATFSIVKPDLFSDVE